MKDSYYSKTHRITYVHRRTQSSKPYNILAAIITVTAVCTVVLLFAVQRKNSRQLSDLNSTKGKGLKMISLDACAMEGEMGAGKLMVSDISEILVGNPWKESDGIGALPVFQVRRGYDACELPSQRMTAEQMRSEMDRMTKALGIQNSKVKEETLKEQFPKCGYEFKDTDVYRMTVSSGDTTITIRCDGKECIEQKKSSPDGFTGKKSISNPDDAQKVLEAYYDKYKKLCPFLTPVYSVEPDNDGNLEFSGNVYEGEGGLREQILSYNFNRISFQERKGTLYITMEQKHLDTHYMGEYPLITVVEAEWMLHHGYYISSCKTKNKFSGEAEKVELVYLTDGNISYDVPYYCFYVKSSSPKSKNVQVYEEYYVPAIEPQYIDCDLLWDTNKSQI